MKKTKNQKLVNSIYSQIKNKDGVYYEYSLKKAILKAIQILKEKSQ